MRNSHIRSLAFAGMMAVLTALVTLVVRVASPLGGYVNLGDCIVLLCGWLLGPWWGAAAAGLGAALADILSGCAYFAPGTLLIKALMAMTVWGVTRLLRRSGLKPRMLQLAGGALAAELLMIAGYFAYAALILGRGSAALLSVPGNLVQGGAALTLGVLLALVLEKIPEIKNKENE